MAHDNSSRRTVNLNHKILSKRPIYSLFPSTPVNEAVVSSPHLCTTDISRRTSTPSTVRSTSSNSRARHAFNGHSTIQMEPSLQALLAAEGQAAEMIARARVKRNELLRQSNRESQVEIEAFRREREAQYKVKLHEATQLEQFQEQLNAERHRLLKQMEDSFKKERKELVNYIIHCVIDEIPVEPHPNAKRFIF